MLDSSSERIAELESALECAGRILLRKHEASSRQSRRWMAAEAALLDLGRRIEDKDHLLRKVIGLACDIRRMNGRGNRPQEISAKVSVVLPVRNGGEQLGLLLGKIRSQRKVRDVEIIVLDSESTDSSVQTARNYGAKIVPIPRSEFNHGGTRNIGAAEADGDYLVFTVQDATPVSHYWLYGMVCPLVQYPDLAALSARQFIRPEADLFSLWSNDAMMKSLGYEEDTFYSLSSHAEGMDWGLLDSITKRRLSFLDNVSSCIRRDVFQKIPFRPLVNAEDIDYGVQLLERRMPVGYLTSTGVYHWHERGADDVFKRNYIGTKAQIYVLRNDLPHLFLTDDIDLACMLESVRGLYDLVAVSISESAGAAVDPPTAMRLFVAALHANIDSSPERFEKKMRKRNTEHDALDSYLTQVIGTVRLRPERKYLFRKNLFIPGFLGRLGEFAEYLCRNHSSLNGREKEFVSSLFKIYAISAGNGLGLYYIERETSNRLISDLRRIDGLMGKGVCYA